MLILPMMLQAHTSYYAHEPPMMLQAQKLQVHTSYDATSSYLLLRFYTKEAMMLQATSYCATITKKKQNNTRRSRVLSRAKTRVYSRAATA